MKDFFNTSSKGYGLSSLFEVASQPKQPEGGSILPVADLKAVSTSGINAASNTVSQTATNVNQGQVKQANTNLAGAQADVKNNIGAVTNFVETVQRNIAAAADDIGASSLFMGGASFSSGAEVLMAAVAPMRAITEMAYEATRNVPAGDARDKAIAKVESQLKTQSAPAQGNGYHQAGSSEGTQKTAAPINYDAVLAQQGAEEIMAADPKNLESVAKIVPEAKELYEADKAIDKAMASNEVVKEALDRDPMMDRHFASETLGCLAGSIAFGRPMDLGDVTGNLSQDDSALHTEFNGPSNGLALSA